MGGGGSRGNVDLESDGTPDDRQQAGKEQAAGRFRGRSQRQLETCR